MPAAAFDRWRASLTRVLARCSGAIDRVRLDGVGRAARAWVRPSSAAALEAHDLPVAIAAGACVVFAAAAVAARCGLRSWPAFWQHVVGLTAWSAARFVVLRALAPSANIPSRAATAAWATALPPFALAAVPGLGLAAFVLSLGTAYSALIAFGASRKDAARLVAWAYGGHAAGAALSALASAALAG